MLQPQDQVGRYEIQRLVAHGGMGTLYLAKDPVLGRSVALKFFQGGVDPDAHERFVREARAVAALSHPNIVTIYDYGEYESHHYIVMEFIQGETLDAVIRRKDEVGVVTRLRWLEELTSAVGYAHTAGIIHRDVKPANLMVDGYGRLRVLDFGIARMRGSLASSATARIGTPGYMAPEQLRGGAVDHRSDLFSIGVVAYELLSYLDAFGGQTEHLTTHRVLHEDPAPLADVCPGVDEALAQMVGKALQKDPEQRYQDAETLIQALASVRRRLELLAPETVITRYKPPAERASADETVVLRPTPSSGGQADREAIIRKRTAQIREATGRAAVALQDGDLVAARAACDEVLSLDRTHPEALAILRSVEEQSRTSLSSADTVMLPAVRADGPQPSARGIDPQRPSGVYTPRNTDPPLPTFDDRTVVRPPQPHTAAKPAPPLDDDETIGAMPTVMSSAPTVRPGVPPVATRPSGAASSQPPSKVTSKATPVKPPAPVWTARWRALPRHVRVAVVTAPAALVIVVVSLLLWQVTMTPPEKVAVVLDATPWATVARVSTSGGGAIELPSPAVTPLVLSLDPGRYEVSFVGPPAQPETRTVTIDVSPGQEAKHLEPFTPMTVERYFEAYLTTSETAPADLPPATGRGGQ